MGNGWVLGNFFYFSFLHKILWIFFFFKLNADLLSGVGKV
jgi:hypothetical protein